MPHSGVVTADNRDLMSSDCRLDTRRTNTGQPADKQWTKYLWVSVTVGEKPKECCEIRVKSVFRCPNKKIGVDTGTVWDNIYDRRD